MKKRIEEIVAKLKEFDGVDNYSKDDIEVINGLNEEFETLKSNIEAQEKIEAMKASAIKPERKVATKTSPRVEVKHRTDNTLGFENLGELAMAVVRKSRGQSDRRFENETAYEKFAEDGGLLIPTEFMKEINEKVKGDESLMAMCDVTPVTGNSMSLPIDEEEPWNGGIQTYWVAEGAPITDSKSALKNANYRLHKVAALVKSKTINAAFAPL